jgi:hypothetical protein
MPVKEIDYSKTIIYKIVCNDLAITDLYVGSTTQFTIRKSRHKYSCNNINNKNYNFKIYQTIRDNGGWLNWSMVQIEEFPCANGNEARARERYFYEQLNATLNERYPIRAQKEYRKEYKTINKDRIMQQDKEYRILNKDKKSARDAIPYNCECGSVRRIGDKSKHFKTKKHLAFIAQKDNIET